MMSGSNFRLTLKLADTAPTETIRDAAIETIAWRCTDMLALAEFNQLSEAALKRVCANQGVNCPEIELFRACVRWACLRIYDRVSPPSKAKDEQQEREQQDDETKSNAGRDLVPMLEPFKVPGLEHIVHGTQSNDLFSVGLNTHTDLFAGSVKNRIDGTEQQDLFLSADKLFNNNNSDNLFATTPTTTSGLFAETTTNNNSVDLFGSVQQFLTDNLADSKDDDAQLQSTTNNNNNNNNNINQNNVRNQNKSSKLTRQQLAVQYGLAHPDELRKELASVLPEIRFPCMSVTELCEVRQTGVLSDDTIVQCMIHIGKQKIESTGIFAGFDTVKLSALFTTGDDAAAKPSSATASSSSDDGFVSFGFTGVSEAKTDEPSEHENASAASAFGEVTDTDQDWTKAAAQAFGGGDTKANEPELVAGFKVSARTAFNSSAGGTRQAAAFNASRSRSQLRSSNKWGRFGRS
eukprot:TRINITY_DN65940_c4_g2_i1.p1 TRINITY_DN65940_c4_g2~~TRINITY_DN65940_c4_g2_i1.p1  ORF type:complete len:463 (-),score=209.30 TRINITY_DN65940_c4_g2_i1:46-1434(-)